MGGVVDQTHGCSFLWTEGGKGGGRSSGTLGIPAGPARLSPFLPLSRGAWLQGIRSAAAPGPGRQSHPSPVPSPPPLAAGSLPY